MFHLLVVCSTVDGASTMFSARQSIVNRQKQQYNTTLLCQHCLNHCEVGKARHKLILEETIEDLLRFFKYSTLHQSQFHAQGYEMENQCFDKV